MATRLNNWKCFGGFVSKWSHQSVATKTEMKFSVFLPSIALASSAQQQRVPVLYWLSGLTCNEDNMIQKAGAMQACEDAGIALVCPDTSPRGEWMNVACMCIADRWLSAMSVQAFRVMRSLPPTHAGVLRKLGPFFSLLSLSCTVDILTAPSIFILHGHAHAHTCVLAQYHVRACS